MEIEVVKFDEAGYGSSMYGLSLSYGTTVERAIEISKTLCCKDYGHNKFLEHIYIWIKVRAPRYWWQEADTYRMSSKQSESTMHTISKRFLIHEDFEDNEISESSLEEVNIAIATKDIVKIKKKLPESFMQIREWCISYKTLRNMYIQRKNHKLPHWNEFFEQLITKIDHPHLITYKYDGDSINGSNS